MYVAYHHVKSFDNIQEDFVLLIFDVGSSPWDIVDGVRNLHIHGIALLAFHLMGFTLDICLQDFGLI